VQPQTSQGVLTAGAHLVRTSVRNSQFASNKLIQEHRHLKTKDATLGPCAVLCIATLLAASFAALPAQAGALLVSGFQSNSIGAYDAITGATINANFITLGYTFDKHALALDGSNHLFIANSSQNTVSEYDATTGAIINANFISGLNVPFSLVLDASNHLFVSNTGVPGGTVGEYNATTGAAINANFISINQGLQSAYAIALDTLNNHLFVSDATSNNIAEFDATTGATTAYGFIHREAFGLALDGHNHLFAAVRQFNSVVEYDATSGAVINASFIAGLDDPSGVAFDGNNHLFVTNMGNNTVGEYDATTGAAINATFISGQGLDQPASIAFAASVPEPSTLMPVVLGLFALLGRTHVPRLALLRVTLPPNRVK
jgi:sugar lactone lactonase YvrE